MECKYLSWKKDITITNLLLPIGHISNIVPLDHYTESRKNKLSGSALQTEACSEVVQAAVDWGTRRIYLEFDSMLLAKTLESMD
jgi:hypothetical protein